MASFRVIKDKKLTTLKFEKGNASLTRCSNISYEDTFLPQTNLATNPPFKVQLVSDGNQVTFSWKTVIITAGAGGDVTGLTLKTKIPQEYIPALADNGGQNYPIYINNTVFCSIYVDIDGSVYINPTDTNTSIIPASGTTFIWGSSITWTTNNS